MQYFIPLPSQYNFLPFILYLCFIMMGARNPPFIYNISALFPPQFNQFHNFAIWYENVSLISLPPSPHQCPKFSVHISVFLSLKWWFAPHPPYMSRLSKTYSFSAKEIYFRGSEKLLHFCCDSWLYQYFPEASKVL